MSRIVADNSHFSYRNGEALMSDTGCQPHTSTRFRNWSRAKNPCELPELYSKREDCCGCTACECVCSVSAITMETDEEGFDYPVVDANACIYCGKCIRSCPFKSMV